MCDCNEGICLPKGPKGDPGATGATGAIGATGPAGPTGSAGPSEYYATVTGIDHTWGLVENTLPNSYTLVGPSNTYIIQAALKTTMESGCEGTLRLYVNGALVESVNELRYTTSNASDEIQSPISFIWRGNINNGDLIEFRTIRIGAPILNIESYQWVITNG